MGRDTQGFGGPSGFRRNPSLSLSDHTSNSGAQGAPTPGSQQLQLGGAVLHGEAVGGPTLAAGSPWASALSSPLLLWPHQLSSPLQVALRDFGQHSQDRNA